ncbi:MAG: extracellular solute-binding protein [Candidatus Limivivens sp.]|nr:extracellular solute-binding protein [Candidatus Limivivens sp.]
MRGTERNGAKKRKTGMAVLLLLGAWMLSGCGGGEGEQTKESGSQEVVLKAYIQQAVTRDAGIWEGWAAKRLYEDTGIKVDFQNTGSEVEQKLKQYIAAGTLPDILGVRSLDQAQMAVDAGLLLPLDEYSELLPAIFETEEYKKAVSYSRVFNSGETGHLYAMPLAVGPTSDNAFNWLPMLQWDAYKKAGSPQISTLEDYLDVVEKMVQEKPYTENGEKVYGFSLFSDWDKYSALEAAALSYFYGIDTEYVSHLMETDVINKTTRSILSDDSFYKRALHFYFEANQRGLLDPDSRTQTYENMERKYSRGRILFSWFSWLTGTYNDTASGHVNNPEAPDGYVSIPAADMKIYEAPDQNIGRNWYLAVSSNSKYPEKACEFLNWLYDSEVECFLYNGPEGVTWEYGEDGAPRVTEEGWEIIDNKTEDRMPEEIGGGSFQDGMGPFNSLGLQAATLMENGYSISYRYWPSTRERDLTLVEQEVHEMLGTDTIAGYLEEHDMIAKSTMAVNMIPSVSDEMKAKIESIGEIVRDISWKMVYAKNEEEFQFYWSSMQSQAKELGMDQVEANYQKAWKKALGNVAYYE